MRYLRDTNIISNVTKPAPSQTLLAWMAEQTDRDLYIASLTVAEIRRGVLERPKGQATPRTRSLVRRAGGAASAVRRKSSTI